MKRIILSFVIGFSICSAAHAQTRFPQDTLTNKGRNSGISEPVKPLPADSVKNNTGNTDIPMLDKSDVLKPDSIQRPPNKK
jgi:hypothetical protein